MGGLIGAAASIFGASKSASAAEKAAGLQAQAAREGVELQREQWETTREDLAPYRQAGYGALNTLMDMFVPGGSGGIQNTQQLSELQTRRNALLDQLNGITPTTGSQNLADLNQRIAVAQSDPSRFNELQQLLAQRDQQQQQGTGPDTTGINNQLADIDAQIAALESAPAGDATTPDYSAFYQSPAYTFQMEQGQQALDRSAAARGRLNSGAQSLDTLRFSQGLATQAFDGYANRLASIAGLGQNATNTSAAYGANFANNAAAGLNNAAASQASGIIGSSNAWNQGLGNLAFSAGMSNGFGINNLLGGLGGGGGGVPMNISPNALANGSTLY